MNIPNRQPSEQSETAHAANYLVEVVPLIVYHPGPPHDWVSLYPLDFGVLGDRFVNSETDSENDACHHCCAADRGHAVINRNWESRRHLCGPIFHIFVAPTCTDPHAVVVWEGLSELTTITGFLFSGTRGCEFAIGWQSIVQERLFLATAWVNPPPNQSNKNLDRCVSNTVCGTP